MRSCFRRMFAFLIISAIVLSPETISNAEYKVPDTIRVGLFFSYPSVHIDTALSVFNVTASAGLDIGFFKNGKFNELYSEPSSSLLLVRKDSYYLGKDGKISEYNPSSNVPPGDKFGPYHIKIGGGYASRDAAEARALVLNQYGIQAFVAFENTWQVWTGFYIDEASAQKDIVKLNRLPGAGSCSVMQPSSTRVVVTDQKNKPLCALSENSIYLSILPKPEKKPDVFSINGKPYRGYLEIRRISGSDMTVINVVKLQEYLYGNVPPEIGGNAPAEALKAQAVVSKMYAINNMGRFGSLGFDICATTICQVYKGYACETAAADAAVDAVKDKVIMYQGKPASQIYYFASSGGRTEDSENVWGYPYPYLKSVDDKYDPVYTWTKTLRASDVKALIPNIGNILGMSIEKTSQTGRVTLLAVRGDRKSDPAIYSLSKCRTVFGLDSQLYTITTDADVYVGTEDNKSQKTQLGGKKVITSSGVKTLNSSNNKVTVVGAGERKSIVALVPETYTFTGKGWGHGVGMSQEGAIGMGKAGIKYSDILEHYFPGTKVE